MHYYLNHLYITFLLGWCLVVLALTVNGQPNVQTHQIELTYNKTSNIIFPTVIKSVDRGSRDVLAQKAKDVPNVLQLKAGKEDFPETNLTVITADGILHQFTVKYSSQPMSLTLDIRDSSDVAKSSPLIFQTAITDTEMENYSTGILQTKRTIWLVNESNYKIDLVLLGIYVKDDIMFYRFRIRNRSNINYDVDLLKFYIRDNSRIKRTASQEIVIKPINVYSPGDRRVKANSETDVVYALHKFTIPESKHLNVEMFELNGGRNFNLAIKNKTIVNAKLLH